MSFCSWLTGKKPEPETATSWCVPESIFCAWTFGKDYPVRLAVQKLRPGTDHVQAESFIDGKWTPLTPYWTGKQLGVKTYKRHFDVEPYRYLTLREWVNEQIQFVTKEA